MRYFSLKLEQFQILTPVQIWNDLWPIILCNLKTKHRRCIKLYIFRILMIRQTKRHYFRRNRSMFQFLTHVELSRSMTAILEMPQYVTYHKNVVYAFIKLSAKSHNFNILCTMNRFSCPTNIDRWSSICRISTHRVKTLGLGSLGVCSNCSFPTPWFTPRQKGQNSCM